MGQGGGDASHEGPTVRSTAVQGTAVESDAVDGEDAGRGIGGEGDEADLDHLDFLNQPQALAVALFETDAPGEEADAAFAQGAVADEGGGVGGAAGGGEAGAEPEPLRILARVQEAAHGLGEVVLPEQGEAVSALGKGGAEGAGPEHVGLTVGEVEGGRIARYFDAPSAGG